MAGTPLNVKDPEAHQLATLIAEHTGKTLTRVVLDALRHEKERVIPRKVNAQRVREILARVDSLPILDPRASAEILAGLYDEHGLPR